MPRLACLTVLLACLSSPAYACEATDEDPAVRRAEHVLNHLYARVWTQADDERRELLERAQLAWLDYRDAACVAAGMRDGVTAHAPFATCLIFMTRARTLELRLMAGTVTPTRSIQAP